MIQNGLNKIWPHTTDFSLVPTFGMTGDDIQGLPANFSIFDGQPIPNQNFFDLRFNPPIRPLPFGCTAEAGSFAAGLEDGALYRPDDLYDNTPGLEGQGRQMRDMLQTLIDRGPRKADGTFGPKRLAYFNCYGVGDIDDFDAARAGVWINQAEKRAVIFGIWWYPEFISTINGTLPIPSFNTKDATLHCPIITGWRTNGATLELEVISWQGDGYGLNGLCYVTREEYNALMAQPYTAAFTMTAIDSHTPIPIGWQAVVDHFVYWVKSLMVR